MAKAYILSGTGSATELHDIPPLDAIEENFKTYFFITKGGMDLHLSAAD